MGGPLSLQTELLRLEINRFGAGAGGDGHDSFPFSSPESVVGIALDNGLNLITTDLGDAELTTLRGQPEGEVSRSWLGAPEPPTALTLVAGLLSFAAVGVRRKILHPEHRPLRKRIRVLYRMMA